MKKNILLTLTVGCLMATAIFTGCDNEKDEKSNAADNVTDVVGQLTLSVNPEIMISYNKDGRVTDVKGTNADGRDIVENYDDYIGKYCGRVLTELVDEIHEAGYFVEEADGSQKRIVLELEEGSEMPDDDFLEELGGNIEQAVTRLDLTSDVVVRDDDDDNADDNNDTDDGVSNYFDDDDYEDTDYGPENDGVTDYFDTDYGPYNDGITDYDDGASSYDDTADDSASNYDDAEDSASNYDDDDDSVSNYDDGVSNYTPAPTNPPAVQAPAVQTPAAGGDSGYDDGASNYDDGASNYDDGASNYDDGASDYDD